MLASPELTSILQQPGKEDVELALGGALVKHGGGCFASQISDLLISSFFLLS